MTTRELAELVSRLRAVRPAAKKTFDQLTAEGQQKMSWISPYLDPRKALEQAAAYNKMTAILEGISSSQNPAEELEHLVTTGTLTIRNG